MQCFHSNSGFLLEAVVRVFPAGDYSCIKMHCEHVMLQEIKWTATEVTELQQSKYITLFCHMLHVSHILFCYAFDYTPYFHSP